MDSLPGCTSAVNTVGLSTLSWNSFLKSAGFSAASSSSLVGPTPRQIRTLEDIHRTVLFLSLETCPYSNIERQKVIGKGETFLVERCSVWGQVVAVKHLKLTSMATDTPTFSARLRAVLLELHIMRHANIATHPNILSLLAYGWHRDMVPYIIVDYSPHGTLRDFLLRHKRMPIHQRKRLVLDVAAGLDALHLTGIIHGDVKLENSLVFDRCGDPQAGKLVKICDFGHSLLLNGDDDDLRYRGTSLYNAPEVQKRPSSPIPKELLHKCDVWAFGLFAWEVLLSGKVYRDCLTSPSDSSSDKDQLGLDGAQLRNFAIASTQSLEEGFHKLFFCGLFHMTLQDRPQARTSFLTANLPVRKEISQESTLGGLHVLSKPPSLDLGETPWSADIFRPEQKRNYSWDHQRSIFQIFEMNLSKKTKNGELLGSAAWQLGLCHLSGFGTPVHYYRGIESIDAAEKYKHPVAVLFGSILRTSPGRTDRRETYVNTVASAFQAQLQEPGESRLALWFDFPFSPKRSDYDIEGLDRYFDSYLSLVSSLRRSVYPWEDDKRRKKLQFILSSGRITILGETRKTMGILELAISLCDQDLIRNLCAHGVLKGNPSLGPLLVQACRLGEANIVESLLVAGADIDYVASDGTTFFHWLFMLEERSISSFQVKLSHGSFKTIGLPCRQVHYIHRQWPLRLQGTPLAFAVSVGNTAAVKLLLALGANPVAPAFGSIVDGSDQIFDWTPVHIAAQLYDAEMMKTLLESVSSRKYPPYDSFTHALTCHSPVEVLAFHGWPYINALEDTMLVLNRMKKWSISKPSPALLAEAIHLHDASVVRSLLSQHQLLVRRPIAQTHESLTFTYPLHLATQEAGISESPSSYAVLTAILDADPSVLKERDSKGRTPLHIAVTKHSDRAARWFLEREPTLLSMLDYQGRSALHYCASTQSTQLLLIKGAALNLPDGKGMTAMHCAAESGAAQALQRLLISSQANINAKDGTRSTPLHYAASKGSFEATRYLLAFGAAVDEQNQEGNTPLHLAVGHGCDDITRLLIEYGRSSVFVKNAQGQSPCHIAVAHENYTAISFLTATVASKDVKGNTPIHLCALAGKAEMMSLLMSSCSQLEASEGNADGQTPLHMAVQAFALDCVKRLLDKGVSPDVKDLRGNTPLHVALKAPESPDCVALCAILHAAGASLTEKDGDSLMPWDIAVKAKAMSTMQFLVETGGVSACRGLIFTDALLQAALGEKDIDQMSAIYNNETIVLLEQCHRRLLHHAIEAGNDLFQSFFELEFLDYEKHACNPDYDALMNQERVLEAKVPAVGRVGRVWAKASRIFLFRTAQEAGSGESPAYSDVNDMSVQTQSNIMVDESHFYEDSYDSPPPPAYSNEPYELEDSTTSNLVYCPYTPLGYRGPTPQSGGTLPSVFELSAEPEPRAESSRNSDISSQGDMTLLSRSTSELSMITRATSFSSLDLTALGVHKVNVDPEIEPLAFTRPCGTSARGYNTK